MPFHDCPRTEAHFVRQQKALRMKTTSPISIDQYFRELEAIARIRQQLRNAGGTSNILNFMGARERLRSKKTVRLR